MIDITEKQNIARENGRKSKGPITPEGKQRSSLNGITHGLASKCVVLCNESEELYTQLLTGYQSEWQPATLTEQHLVTQMVNSYWRLRRIWSMETALFDSEMFTQKEDFEAVWSHHHPAMRVTDTLAAIQITNPGTLNTLSRYESRYQRTYKTAMDQLRKLRRDRHAPDITLRDAAKPVEIPVRQDQPTVESEIKTSWQTRLLAFLVSVIAALRLRPNSTKHARNRRIRTSEPTAISEAPFPNFNLPEMFNWLSLFTATPSRPKPDFNRAQPEEPDAV